MRRHQIRMGLALAATLLIAVAGTIGAALAHDDHEGGHKRAYLGVALGGDDDGVRILSVADNSPAEAAGLERGDVVIAIDGKPVEDADEFMRSFRDYRPGDSPRLTVRRDGGETTVQPVLEERERHFIFSMDDIEIPDIEIPEINIPGFNFRFKNGGEWSMSRRGYLGVHLQPLTEELRAYFGAPEHEGILIARVEPDSPAARGGLEVGDVITRIDSRKVDSQGDLLQGLADLEDGDAVEIEVVRRGRSESFNVQVEMKEGKTWSFRSRCDDDDEECPEHFMAPFGGGEGNFQFMMDGEWQERLEKRMQELQERLERFTPEVRDGVHT